MSDLSALEVYDDYCRLFIDVPTWSPYVRDVCQKHGLTPCQQIRIGVPGTYPAFIVDDRWVVKFFGRLFDGGRAFAVECESARLAAGDTEIPIARVSASGALGEEIWPWPYLVFDFIPGRSIGEQRSLITPASRLQIAKEMGEMARRLHALPLEGSTVFPNDHEDYRRFLEDRRANCLRDHRGWGSLPAHLLDSLEAFLPPIEDLIDRTRPPHLIHGDLTRDHLLGRVENGCWQTQALIDFGDARTGDFLYELAALYFDLFAADREMLRVFLAAYGLPEHLRHNFPRKALATMLLHQFDVASEIPPEYFECASLEALAEKLYRF